MSFAPSIGTSSVPSFEFRVPPEREVSDVLLVGLANPGLAGLTAVDYLVTHVGADQIGHVRSRGLADITPFTAGEPRYPIRLYDAGGVTVLVNELFLPVWTADPFGDGLFEWMATSGFEELAILHGVPYPHGPDEHRVFQVSVPEFRERRLVGSDVQPLGGGFFDGVAGELMARGLEADTPPVGALVTPTHPPGPDLDAAILFLDAIGSLYDIEVDETELRQRSEELKRYYAELANRMQTLESTEGGVASRDYPEDRMYM